MDREFHVQMANFSHTNISDVCFYFPQSKEKNTKTKLKKKEKKKVLL